MYICGDLNVWWSTLHLIVKIYECGQSQTISLVSLCHLVIIILMTYDLLSMKEYYKYVVSFSLQEY